MGWDRIVMLGCPDGHHAPWPAAVFPYPTECFAPVGVHPHPTLRRESHCGLPLTEYDTFERVKPEPTCNGLCMTGHDVGVPSSGIAYPHPDCEAHGWGGMVPPPVTVQVDPIPWEDHLEAMT